MIIDSEFKDLIPPLSSEEYKQLEENILKDGIRDSLVIWDNGTDWILIDGHNRFEIAQKHNLPYNQRRMEFPNRDAVKEWIIRNQLGRRNIPAYVRAELALRLKPIIAEKAKEKQAEYHGNQYDGLSQKSVKVQTPRIDTQKEVAKAAGVSHDTIHKVEKIQEKATEEQKQDLRTGKRSINEVYRGIIADEHETKRQEADRELREAKKRHADYTENKAESVVSFTEAKQDKEDAKLISKRFCQYFYDKGQGIDNIHTEIKNKGLDFLLSGATDSDIKELENHLERWSRYITHIQQLLTERRQNEK